MEKIAVDDLYKALSDQNTASMCHSTSAIIQILLENFQDWDIP